MAIVNINTLLVPTTPRNGRIYGSGTDSTTISSGVVTAGGGSSSSVSITLTTTGSSGSATLTGTSLNIPTITLAGLNGQTLLSGTGIVTSSAGIITYDTNTYLPTSGGTITGNVTITGTTNISGITTLGNNLVVGGSVVASGDVTGLSDKRLKQNIQALTPILKDLLKIKVVEYNRYDLDDNKHIGVIAQELKEIFPLMVAGNEEDYYSVNYSGLVVYCIKAIQELMIEINRLKYK